MGFSTYVPKKITEGSFLDVTAPVSGDDGKVLAYNNGTGVLDWTTVYTAAQADAAIASAVSTHAALTSTHGVSGALVGTTDAQQLSSKELITPTIASFANAAHTHADAAGGGTIAHSVLTGLTTGDPHTQYLLATGTRSGASSQAQTFTAGIRSPKVIAIADSTNAGGWYKADGTTQDVYYDSTNGRVGIGTSPSAPLHIVSSSQDELARFGNGTRDIILKMNNGAGTGNLFKSSNVGAKILYEFGDEYFGIHNGSASFGHKAYDASGNGLKFLTLGQSAFGDYYAAYTGTRIGLRVSYPTASWIQFCIKGATSQTANLQEWQNSAAGIQFAVGAAGQLKTNQSATNTNTPSGATAHQLPIYNASGTLLGYIPIYASAWT